MRISDRSARFFSVASEHTGIPGLRTLTAEFRRADGQLVDVECNRVGCDRFRGARLNEVLREMRCAGSKKVGLNHCAGGELYGARRRRRRRR